MLPVEAEAGAQSVATRGQRSFASSLKGLPGRLWSVASARRVALQAALLISFIVAYFGVGWGGRFYLGIELGNLPSTTAQVFYDDGGGYRQAHSSTFGRGPSNWATQYVVPLPPGVIHGLRFDPATNKGTLLQIGRIYIFNSLGIIHRELSHADIAGLRDLRVMRDEVGLLHLETIDTPPSSAFDGCVPDETAWECAGYVFDPQLEIFRGRMWLNDNALSRVVIGALMFVWLMLAWSTCCCLRRPAGRSTAAFLEVFSSSRRTLGVGALVWLALTYVINHFSFAVWEPEPFGEAFNQVAAALMNGRLDVAPGSFGGETIRWGGLSYVYFGLWPAVFRIAVLPFAQLDTNIARPLFMMLALGSLVLPAAFVRLAARHVDRPPDARGRDIASATAIAAVGLASPLLIFVGRSYIYHEAILWATLGACATIYFLLRLVLEPSRGALAGVILCTFVTVHSRFTSIIAIAVVGLVCGLEVLRRNGGLSELLRLRSRHVRLMLYAGAGMAIAVLSIERVNSMKFNTLGRVSPPMEHHYGHPFERFAHFGNSLLSFGNLTDRAARYLGEIVPPRTPRFPHVAFATGSRSSARDDIIEPYTGLVPTTIGIIGLLAAAGARLAGSWTGIWRYATLAALLQFLPALLFAGVTFRYLLELLPALMVPVALAGLVVAASSRRLTLAIAALVVGGGLNALLAYRFQGEHLWGMPQRFIEQYATATGMSLGDVYWPVFGATQIVRDLRIERIDGNMYRYRTLRQHGLEATPLPLAAAGAKFAGDPDLQLVRHTSTGIVFPLDNNRCHVHGMNMRRLLQIVESDLPWLVPMTGSMVCNAVEGADQHNLVQENVAFIARPISLPKSPGAYLQRFRATLEDMCAQRAWSCAPKGPADLPMPAFMPNGWSHLIEARCEEDACLFARTQRTSSINGVVIGAVLQVGREAIHFYQLFPIETHKLAVSAGEYGTMLDEFRLRLKLLRELNAVGSGGRN